MRVSTNVLLIGAALAVVTACSKKKHPPPGPPPEVTGLGAVPSDAAGIIGIDVSKMASSPIVSRAIDQLLSRENDLSRRWKAVREGCKIDIVQQVRRMMIVLGPTPEGGRVGTGPALLIAIGKLPELDLASCVSKLVGKGGGTVTGQPVNGHTLYTVQEGNRAMYLAFGRADTAVLGNNEAYVTQAVGSGKKALDQPDLADWLHHVDQNAPVWAVGRIDPRVRQALTRVVKGLGVGPVAFSATIDPSEGFDIAVDAVMASAADAKALESWGNTERAFLSMAAQRWSLGPLVSKVTIQAVGPRVQIRAPLDMKDVNQMLSVLDDRKPPAQDSAPSVPPQPAPGSANGSGSAATK